MTKDVKPFGVFQPFSPSESSEVTMQANRGALGGLLVLDLSRLLPGPYCTMILADHGARVIAIEDRHYREDEIFLATVNLNKEHMTLNLKSAEGREIFYRLAAAADVVVEGFRPEVVKPPIGIENCKPFEIPNLGKYAHPHWQNVTFMQGWVAFRTRKERKLSLVSDPHTYDKPEKIPHPGQGDRHLRQRHLPGLRRGSAEMNEKAVEPGNAALIRDLKDIIQNGFDAF